MIRWKSRRDGILLTVGFNLRTRDMSSLQDFGVKLFRLIRRLKPTVNKVSSLRDFSTDITSLQVVYFSSLKENITYE